MRGGRFAGVGLRVPTLRPMAGAWQGGADPCAKRRGGLLGLEITHVGGDHLGVVACPMKFLEGQVAHHAAMLMHQHRRT